MTKTLVGQVSHEEMKEILSLYERKNGLTELARIVTPDNNTLYERLVMDMGVTQSKYESWWNRMSQKYDWQSVDGGNWEIDFDTCKIYLVR